jgi:hypothetical protein
LLVGFLVTKLPSKLLGYKHQSAFRQSTLFIFCVVALLIFKLCLNISKATNQVTLPQLINFVDKQGRGLRPLLHFINEVDRQSREICFKLTKLATSS